MNLHTDTKLFSETIRATSQHTGIREVFIEKDYWITLVLSQLAKSKYSELYQPWLDRLTGLPNKKTIRFNWRSDLQPLRQILTRLFHQHHDALFASLASADQHSPFAFAQCEIGKAQIA